MKKRGKAALCLLVSILGFSNPSAYGQRLLSVLLSNKYLPICILHVQLSSFIF
jgi:hypothetical protein